MVGGLLTGRSGLEWFGSAVHRWPPAKVPLECTAN